MARHGLDLDDVDAVDAVSQLQRKRLEEEEGRDMSKCPLLVEHTGDAAARERRLLDLAAYLSQGC